MASNRHGDKAADTRRHRTQHFHGTTFVLAADPHRRVKVVDVSDVCWARPTHIHTDTHLHMHMHTNTHRRGAVMETLVAV